MAGVSAPCYRLYGLVIKSPLPLLGVRLKNKRLRPDITIAESDFQSISDRPPEFFSRKKSRIYYSPLSSGACWIQFYGIMRFWVSPDGKRVLFQKLLSQRKNKYAVRAFLQTNVLSFSLIRLGAEVFHASAVLDRGKAAAFLGESGYGKSSLAAGLVKRGASFLTDDVFAIRKEGNHYSGLCGVPHIKLLPDAAKKVRPSAYLDAGKMAPWAKKNVFTRKAGISSRRTSFSIRVLYVLWPRFRKLGGIKVWARNLRGKEALMSLVRSSHNLVLEDGERLKKQMRFISKLIQKIPVRALSYPMHSSKYEETVEFIRRDLKRI